MFFLSDFFDSLFVCLLMLICLPDLSGSLLDCFSVFLFPHTSSGEFVLDIFNTVSVFLYVLSDLSDSMFVYPSLSLFVNNFAPMDSLSLLSF